MSRALQNTFVEGQKDQPFVGIEKRTALCEASGKMSAVERKGENQQR